MHAETDLTNDQTDGARPLASRALHIPFDRIGATDVVPAIREALARAEREVGVVASTVGNPTFDGTLLALDDLLERVSRTFGIARHLTQVASTPELRAAFNEVLPEYSGFLARLATHEGVWRALRAFEASGEAAALAGVRRRHLEKTVREFRRAGADLPERERLRARQLRVELAQLSTRFSENVLDATNAFELVIEDEREVAGLPPSAHSPSACRRRGARAPGVPLHPAGAVVPAVHEVRGVTPAAPSVLRGLRQPRLRR